jgi:sugar-specific transcriptional regulator TrmB
MRRLIITHFVSNILSTFVSGWGKIGKILKLKRKIRVKHVGIKSKATCEWREQLFLPDEDISVLNRAGLTLLQSKLYLVLVLSGKQSIKSVAKMANVDRSNAYREIQRLEEMALVKRIIDSPTLYEAVSPQEGIMLLLNGKAEEYRDTEKQARNLLNRLSYRNTEKVVARKREFVLVPKRTAFMKSAIQNMNSVKKSNDTITNLKRFSQAMPYTFEIHKAALERGVKTRVLMEKPNGERSLPKAIQELMKYPNFEISYASKQPVTLGACFDNSYVGILVDPASSIKESACFETGHPSFVELFCDHFENLWRASEKIKIKSHKAS